MKAGAAIAYTQWEAWLALYYGKPLLIAQPDPKPAEGPAAERPDPVEESQAAHLRRLREVGIYPEIRFANANQLAKRAIKALFTIFRRPLPPARRPRNLPFASLGAFFAGRDEDLADLHTALLAAKGAPVALHGLGGIGKTRLSIEYAWSREAVYSALLFVSASDGAALSAGLAGLAAFEVLDLPEKEARDDATKITAVLRWLGRMRRSRAPIGRWPRPGRHRSRGSRRRAGGCLTGSPSSPPIRFRIRCSTSLSLAIGQTPTPIKRAAAFMPTRSPAE